MKRFLISLFGVWSVCLVGVFSCSIAFADEPSEEGGFRACDFPTYSGTSQARCEAEWGNCVQPTPLCATSARNPAGWPINCDCSDNWP